MTSFPGSGVYKRGASMPHCCSARAQCGRLFDRQTHTETLRHHPPPHPAPVSPQPVRSEQSSSPSPERAPWPAPDRQLLGAPASPCAPPRSWRFFSARGKVSERGPLREGFLNAPDCPEVQAPRSAACPSMPSLRRGEFSAPRTAPRLPPDPAEWPRRKTRRPDSLTLTPDPAGQGSLSPPPHVWAASGPAPALRCGWPRSFGEMGGPLLAPLFSLLPPASHRLSALDFYLSQSSSSISSAHLTFFSITSGVSLPLPHPPPTSVPPSHWPVFITLGFCSHTPSRA